MRYWPVMLLIAGCSSPVPPLLSEADQFARYHDCQDRMVAWRSKGVWVAGGVKPTVNIEKFNALSGAERREIAEIAACIQTNGQYSEPIKVEITEAPNRVLVSETITAENVNWPKRVARQQN